MDFGKVVISVDPASRDGDRTCYTMARVYRNGKIKIKRIWYGEGKPPAWIPWIRVREGDTAW